MIKLLYLVYDDFFLIGKMWDQWVIAVIVNISDFPNA